jgi:hypothetical protein
VFSEAIEAGKICSEEVYSESHGASAGVAVAASEPVSALSPSEIGMLFQL